MVTTQTLGRHLGAVSSILFFAVAAAVGQGCASAGSSSASSNSDDGSGGDGSSDEAGSSGVQSTGSGSLTATGTSGVGGAGATSGTSSTSGASSTGAGGGSGAEEITMLSGNGELVLAGWPGTDPLLVRVTKNGKPVANETVTWTTSGPLHTAANQTTSTTDADGLTSMLIIGEQFEVTTSWVGGTVTATIPTGSVQFTITIAYPGPPVGQGAVSPLAQITAPDSVDLGHFKAGSVIPGGIQALIVAQIGPDSGKGIPNVSLRLADTNDWTKPATGIACVNGTALSDATGKVSCDVQLGNSPGSVGFQVVIGGYNLHPLVAEIDP